MRAKPLITFLLMVISTIWAYAQNSDYVEVQNIENLRLELENTSKATNSIESSFRQEKHLSMLDEVIISEGEFLFKKQNNVLWHYKDPIDYTIIIFNNKFTIVNNKKVSEFDINTNPVFKEINKMIVTAINADFIDNSDFSSSLLQSDTSYLARLTPRNKNILSILSEIDIYIDKQNSQVTKVVFKEPGEDFTLIEFYDKKINTNIPDSRFHISK